MHLVALTTATLLIAEAEVASKFPSKVGVIIASTADTLQVLFLAATLDSKHVDYLSGLVCLNRISINSDFVTPYSPAEWAYLRSRRVPEDYPLMVAATSRSGVVIPFTYNNQVVGSTIRFLDDRNPRYINDMQQGYVFGMDLQQAGWQHAIVTEGIFDALCIRVGSEYTRVAKHSERHQRRCKTVGKVANVANYYAIKRNKQDKN